MSDNSSDDDEITPVFAFRADDIMRKQREAYKEMLKKVEEEDTTKAIENEEHDLLVKIRERQKNRPTAKRKANVKPSPTKTEEKVPSTRRSKRLRKKDVKEDIPEKKLESPIKLPARAKKRLMKLDLQNKRERQRIEELNRRVLSSCFSSSVDDHNTTIEIETEQNITLKISYLSDISKITVNENEKFSSVISKVANLFKLNITEIALYLRDEIINLDATPHSLNVKTWDIIECIPYKSTEMKDEENSSKILIKLQSNDCKKKIEIFAHKLEKFQDIMKRYANLRSLPLKDLIFEFDGERISGSNTPEELDMESGSCVDVKVIGNSLKPASPSIPFIDLEREETPHTILNICVLD
ncbi:NFATC2-interacting protein-like isoform X2 [Argiope bruennichi]|uniref:NFATC2-interacting protein like n=1 Tax=Argiope bruennichi TaxID=94029 RepID=A0A8T0FCD8_ARGBR|nr:NFATC2-interacting protein-like isoform X2 [Argiope bruennichi]KAF8787992.1 NFATC2-interacting protein like [Argiope bruennichi]